MEMKVKKSSALLHILGYMLYNPIVKSGDFSPQSKKKQDFWQPEKNKTKTNKP